jgi:hypothetical protein
MIAGGHCRRHSIHVRRTVGPSARFEAQEQFRQKRIAVLRIEEPHFRSAAVLSMAEARPSSGIDREKGWLLSLRMAVSLRVLPARSALAAAVSKEMGTTQPAGRQVRKRSAAAPALSSI